MPPCARSTSVLLESDSLTERSLAAGGHACVAAASRDAGSRPPRAERPRRRARPPAARRPARLGRASRQRWLGVEGLSAPLGCWAPSLLCLCSTRWCRRLSRRCSAASRRADARGCRSAGWQSAPGKKGAIRRDFSGCLPTVGAYRDFRNGASGLPCPLAAWCAAALTCPLLVSRVRSLAANLLRLRPSRTMCSPTCSRRPARGRARTLV